MRTQSKQLLKQINIFQVLVLIAFAGVIFWPSIAFSGAAAGLSLWASTIIPSLFPALIITSCILVLFPVDNGFSYLYVMIAGCFCGFPVGAFLCSRLYQKNHDPICEEIMAYCNLSSPSFVINYIILSCIGSEYNHLKVLLCIYLPVIEAIAFLLIKYHKKFFNPKNPEISTTSQHNYVSKITISVSDMIDEAIWSSIKSILKLGGYIVVFSCLCAYIVLIPLNNRILTALICGITEITNGIYLCSQLAIDVRLKVLIIVGVNALGGISTIMQTAGITKGSKVSIKKYIYHKLVFTGLTLLNSWLIIYVFI